MAQIADIHRHPVKGWTPESLDQVRLEAGSGVPFDRHFAFTNGRREELPEPGKWVQARTFIQLTFFPELAAFKTKLDDDGLLSLSAPDGSAAQARVGEPEGFGEANAFIQKHFEAGPYGKPFLSEQLPGKGNWDFTDSCVSFVNLASVDAIAKAIGRPLERERFRGNFYIDDLEPWAEFDWPGRRVRIGDVVIEILRPAQRCAMTSTEPGTGVRDFDLPVIMHQTFGHNFCGVYGRVVEGGEIAAGAEITCAPGQVLEPYTILPERVADPALWPRYASAEPIGPGLVKITPLWAEWSLVEGDAGQTVRILAEQADDGHRKGRIIEGDGSGYVCKCEGSFTPGKPVLINGPFGRG